jgi:hypothetical protein
MYVVACVVWACAVGIRSQNLSVCGIPAVMVAITLMRRRGLKPVIVGLTSFATIVAAEYLITAYCAGGMTPYREALAAHAAYIRRVDSYHNPDRPSVLYLLDDFFVMQYGAAAFNYVITALAAAGLIQAAWRHRLALLWIAVAFLPFSLFALFTLEYTTANRFSLGYLPALAILAAIGVHELSRLAGRSSHWVAPVLGSLIVIAMYIRVVPAIEELHTIAPPAAACNWLRAHAYPGETIAVDHPMMKIAELLIPEFPRVKAEPGEPLPPVRFLLVERIPTQETGVTFTRPRRILEKMVRRRYFEVSVIDVRRSPAFGHGWYGPERSSNAVWRWMGREAEITVSPQTSPCTIDLSWDIPGEIGESVVTFASPVTLRIPSRGNGNRVTLPLEPSGQSQTIRLETERTFVPAEIGDSTDTRVLGLSLTDATLRCKS